LAKQMFARLQKLHMIDLTNRSVEEVNGLILKYASILELLKPQHQPSMAVILEVSINHVKETYPTLELDWKAWSIVCLKNKYLKGQVKKESDIPAIIAEFIKHFKDDYADYIQHLGMSATEFDRDYGFVCKYI
jgi:hypothetical protein